LPDDLAVLLRLRTGSRIRRVRRGLDAWVEPGKAEESLLRDLSERHPERALGKALDDDDPASKG
jgi:hypothetical protein